MDAEIIKSMESLNEEIESMIQILNEKGNICKKQRKLLLDVLQATSKYMICKE